MIEHDVLQALRHLPIAVCITQRPDGSIWQCLDTSGSSPTLAEAMAEGLTFLTQKLASDAIVLDDLVAIPAGRSFN